MSRSVCNECLWYESEASVGPLAPDLVLFPPAGSGPSIFRGFSVKNTGCRIHVASLPGRGRRFDETPVRDWERLVEELVGHLEDLVGDTVVLFGHSMGAIVAFEVARRLSVPPVALFAAGAGAPVAAGSPVREQRWSQLTDVEFVRQLSEIGGTPREVLASAELLEFMMPALRADFELVDTYRFVGGGVLSCPVFVLGGDEDATVTADDLAGWSTHTTASTSVTMFPGDHFFVQSAVGEVANLLRRNIRSIVLRGEGSVVEQRG
ncbi:alpha/beta fold hydrolase [Actinomyces naeslundii]|uniref:thioesterase II family protein n=1 Tax=Actinomyces naeslundii TaxID=1655 RepID=UPI0028ED68CE|nr:alpha/beta fold hydrolase [Actinomyces naeslundii]